MAIRWHAGLKVAHSVLRELRKLAKRTKSEIVVESWANCREQGLSFTNYDGYDPKEMRQAVVAECRNSDQIVVVAGPKSEFLFTSNMPSEKLWHMEPNGMDGRYFFGPDQTVVAAEFLFLTLKIKRGRK